MTSIANSYITGRRRREGGEGGREEREEGEGRRGREEREEGEGRRGEERERILNIDYCLL